MATTSPANEQGISVGEMPKRSYALRFSTDVPEQAIAQAIALFNEQIENRMEGLGFIFSKPELQYNEDTSRWVECYYLYADDTCWNQFLVRGEAIVVDHILIDHAVRRAS